MVAPEQVVGVVARLDLAQARPYVRGEERARVGRLLDEVRVVAGAVRHQRGLDVGDRCAHLGVGRLVDDDADRVHAERAGQRRPCPGAGRLARERSAHHAELQHRQRRVAARARTDSREDRIDRLPRQPVDQGVAAVTRKRVERVHRQVAEHDRGNDGEAVSHRPEVAQRAEELLSLGLAAQKRRRHHRERAAAGERGDVGDRREVQQRHPRHELVGEAALYRAPGVEHLGCALEREEQRSGVELVDGMDGELDRGHDAEVAAAAAQRPEQVGVMLVVGTHEGPVGGHELQRCDGVRLQPVLAGQPAHAAAQRVAGDPDIG